MKSQIKIVDEIRHEIRFLESMSEILNELSMAATAGGSGFDLAYLTLPTDRMRESAEKVSSMLDQLTGEGGHER